MRNCICVVAVILALLSPARQSLAQKADPEAVEIKWQIMIPMRDGTRLSATLYRPRGQKRPLPVLLTLTPYGADGDYARANYFALNGYVVLLVDVRGRGNSEGSYRAFIQEPPDGYDVIKWVGKQEWCNGKVAMWGASYSGFAQWMTARERPSALATIVPTASPYSMVDIPAVNAIFYLPAIRLLTFTSGHTNQINWFVDSTFWVERSREYYLKHLPFKSLDQLVGNTSTDFGIWMKHPFADSYWQSIMLTADKYRAMNLPILTITGQYDLDQSGALTYYRQFMEHAQQAAKERHYLVIGPWDHSGTAMPQKDVGGLTFGDASLIDMDELHKQWFDWTVKGSGERPAFLRKQVAYYVTGAEEWKYADSLSQISPEPRRLYLGSTDGKPNDVAHSGTLAVEPPTVAGHDQYVYDPLDVRYGDQFEKEEVADNLTDKRPSLNLFGNGLVYQTQPFSQPTEISGFPKLVTWIAMDVPDTDFMATLYEVRPDGTNVQLTQDLLRARYRESTSSPQPVQPGKVIRYEFKGFNFFSRRIEGGSLVRLVLQSPNTINLEKNYNSGGGVESESAKDARTAHINLFHGPGNASFLDLPVAR